MKNIYFLDTSYIIALEIKNENSHQQVLQNWRSLASSRPLMVTTTYIFDEVVTFFNSRNLHEKAVKIGNRLLESPDIELTDCLSFIVIANRKISTALSLDNHFVQAGFQILP